MFNINRLAKDESYRKLARTKINFRIESTREIINGTKGEETRYYISSLDTNTEKMNVYVREHWCVENKLHWSLDVSFNEDANRTRTDNSAENLSIISVCP